MWAVPRPHPDACCLHVQGVATPNQLVRLWVDLRGPRGAPPTLMGLCAGRQGCVPAGSGRIHYSATEFACGSSCGAAVLRKH